MRIGIIGSGNVGGTLGRRWAESGHEIMFGSRDHSSKKVRSLLEKINGKAKAGTLSDTAAYGEWGHPRTGYALAGYATDTGQPRRLV